MQFSKLFESRNTKIGLSILGGLLIVMVVFEAGLFVGYRRGGFSCGLGEPYAHMFDRRGENGFRGMMDRRPMPSANGAAGFVVKIELPNIVVADREGVEKTVHVSSDTLVRHLQENVTIDQLKLGDSIVVIGKLNSQSQVEAKLIRIIPDMPPIQGGFVQPQPGVIQPNTSLELPGAQPQTNGASLPGVQKQNVQQPSVRVQK